jgi:hypothetical protein
MPIIAWIVGGLLTVTSSFVGRALVALGLGFVSFEGVDTAMDALKSNIMAAASGLPATTIGIMGTLKMGTSVSIILSAIIVRMTLDGLQSGAIKKLVTK